MLCKQLRLRNGNIETVTWVDTEKKCTAGDRIRLKGDDRLWDVTKEYMTLLEKSSIHREWNAGGLDQRNRIT
ncbi:MAG: hypothetical protein KAS32_31615 [Candidatus Peribacteraceae bacterium]|nr:hypothetical protein [Candidatus Peribacteraceae bacterium]